MELDDALARPARPSSSFGGVRVQHAVGTASHQLAEVLRRQRGVLFCFRRVVALVVVMAASRARSEAVDIGRGGGVGVTRERKR